MRWFAGRLALWISAIVLLAIAGFGSLLLATLTRSDGSVRLAGPQAAIEIGRDAFGIVTIRAGSEYDAAFALGYVHAQDRLFQMDLTRRLGAGRLSEVFGPATLRTDRFMRRLGLYRVAAANYQHLPPEAQALFKAYAAGVNAFIARRDGLAAPEFLLQGYRPEPWQPADSLVWGRLMAWQLSGNWRDEQLRRELASRLTPRDLNWIWPTAQRLSALEEPAWMPAPGASNNWVLASARSATGKPLLANDPHLSLDMPAAWYLARIEMPGRVLTGATAPGVPLVVIGHNGHVAWGFTTSQADTQDLFVETLTDDDHFQTAAGPQPLVKRTETIHVRGEADATEIVEETAHGPLIEIDSAAHRGYALAWTGLRPDDRTALGLLEMNRATDAAGFRAALRDFDSPVQNVVYADTAGTIGFMMAGRVPVRRATIDASQMPVPGDTGAYDWTGIIPFEGMPQALNPAQNFLATANNKVIDEAYPYFITAKWEANYRIDRIRQMIAAEPTLDLDGLVAMQMDDLSLAARQLVPLLLAKLPEPMLAGWDNRMDQDRAQPLIFDAWLRQFAHLLLDGRLGRDFSNFWFWDAPLLVEALNGGPASALCDDPGTPAIEDCVLRVKQAHDLAFKALTKAYGPDRSAWRWGLAHRAHFDHPIFSRLPALSWLFDPDLPVDGDNFTVNRASPIVDDDSGAAFDDIHGASLRALFDLADLSRSRFVIAGGQSGNPLSDRYADFTQLWREGRYVTIVGRQESLLRLIPESVP
jgi:penicillin G amidase